MSTPLTLVLTEDGLDALVNAQAGNTANIQITQLGLTQTAFTAAPTLTALPGEFKRVGTFSGVSASETVIHMTAQDSSDDIYDLRGFALYLADGTLFGSFSQTDPVFTKVSIASFLFSVDVAFADAVADNIDFGDATFLYPPATESTKGVAEIATQAEVDDGTDDERIITPQKLAARLADAFGAIVSATEAVEGVAEIATQAEVDAGTDDERFVTALKLAVRLGVVIQSITDESNARQAAVSALSSDLDDAVALLNTADTNLADQLTALRSRTITGSGLVTGGGNLDASRVLQVLAASGAEIAAGLISNKAVTPASLADVPQIFGASSTILGLGGAVMKTGISPLFWNNDTYVTFPLAFPNTCHSVMITPLGDPNGGDEDDEPYWVDRFSLSANGFFIRTTGGGNSIQFSYLAVGH